MFIIYSGITMVSSKQAEGGTEVKVLQIPYKCLYTKIQYRTLTNISGSNLFSKITNRCIK